MNHFMQHVNAQVIVVIETSTGNPNGCFGRSAAYACGIDIRPALSR
jgi:hypothetical protein